MWDEFGDDISLSEGVRGRQPPSLPGVTTKCIPCNGANYDDYDADEKEDVNDDYDDYDADEKEDVNDDYDDDELLTLNITPWPVATFEKVLWQKKLNWVGTRIDFHPLHYRWESFN